MKIHGSGKETLSITRGNTTIHVDSLGAKILQIETDNTPLLHYEKNDIKHSGIPLCLPFFGPLEKDRVFFGDTAYHMGQHGFFRDSEFVLSQKKNLILCTLTSTEETRKKYPFDFLFIAHYEIIDHGVKMVFYLSNTDTKTMEIAPGVHPYFRVENSDEVYITTGAEHGNDSRENFRTKSLEACSDLEVVEHRGEIRNLRVRNTPDIHLIGHELERTIISPGTPDYSLELTADMHTFNRMTIWRKTADAPYICVEPAFEERALNKNAGIKLRPHETFLTTITIQKKPGV
ncbi:MAG: hypothetical protein ACQEQ4_02410 [Fibrobacterota bacterium]